VGDGLDDLTEAVVAAYEQTPWVLIAFEGPESRVVASNAAMRQIAAGRDMRGMNPREALPEVIGGSFYDRIDEVYRTGEAFEARGWRVPMPTPDGGFVELFLNITYSPWYEDDGSIRGVLGTAEVVTDLVQARLEAESKIAELQRQYAAARDLAQQVQQALLPGALPVFPQVELAAHYALAASETAAGGDWYDARPLPDGRVALIVGDVVGHGVEASTVMGQLSVQLRTVLSLGAGDPAHAVSQLDQLSAEVPGSAATTVCVAFLDPSTGQLEYCSAGHPLPLVVDAGSTQGRYLEPTGNRPLGTGETSYRTGAASLGVGDVLVLYTDGLLERPGTDLSRSTIELATAAAHAAAGTAFPSTGADRVPDRVAAEVIELLTRAAGHTDDVTVLAAHRTIPAQVFERTATAAATDAVDQWRSDFDIWLRELAPEPAQNVAVQHAVLELVTNAVDHAYSCTRPGPVTLRAELDSTGRLCVVVADEGRWKTPHPDPLTGGRGLALAGAFVDQLRIERGGNADQGRSARGTVASFAVRLFHPVFHDTSSSRPQDHVQQKLICHLTDGRLTVAGPVDASTRVQFTQAVRDATQHATRPLIIDLSGASHLASAGVQILAEALRQSLTNEVVLTLHAEAGSPAQQVLTLTELPHST
jgi:serine phosphatase RsbU (regulator of sigma subunit)/anti-sigma regulatory factor (Ser/Thr protein kinase)/anti-anti-sigma regulatory factor